MTEKQQQILKGLGVIGPELASFYKDGLGTLEADFEAKSNILAHLMREIDGGLREVFESKSSKKEIQKQIKTEELEALFEEFKDDYGQFDYLADTSFDEFKDARGHIASIMAAFGFDLNHQISKKYIKVVRWLSKYAHRSGAHNKPRNPSDVIKLWYEFEDVLSQLIGNYYAITDRLDTILLQEEPSDETLSSLPNLIDNESRFVYFFNNLKSVKWLRKLFDLGYFNGDLNPQLVEVENNPGHFHVPHWGVLNYLEFVSDENSKTPNAEITELLILIIDDIAGYKDAEGEGIRNFRTDLVIFKLIYKLPIDSIEERHFSYISESIKGVWGNWVILDFDKLIDRFVEQKSAKNLTEALKILLEYVIDEGAFEKINSVFGGYQLMSTLNRDREAMLTVAGEDLMQFCIERIEEILKQDVTSFNNITIPAIEENQQTSFPDRYCCQMTYLVRDLINVLPQAKQKEYVLELLNKEHPIFKRIAYHSIRHHYIELKELFWTQLENPISNSLLKHEIYELLKEHQTTFNDNEISKVLHWIETKEYFVKEEANKEKVIAYLKKEWLTSLLETANPKVKARYDELDKINDAPVDHPGYNTWHSGLVGSESPLTRNEIESMSISELADYFESYLKEKHDFIGPSPEGLSDVLISIIRVKPHSFIDEIEAIQNGVFYFKYSWLRGLYEGWSNEKIDFEIDDVLRVIKHTVEASEFWKNFESKEVYHRSFIHVALHLIQDGIKDDNRAFDPKHLSLIKEILILIYAQCGKDETLFENHSMTVLNNTNGIILSTLVLYSLRLARVEKQETNRWDSEIKDLFNTRINDSGDDPLFYFVLGQYIPNIHYLDEQWLFENFNSIFPIEDQTNWTAAMSGYLFFHRRPIASYYTLFDAGNHFMKIIENDIDGIETDIRASLIQKICIAYLFEVNETSIDSPLIQALIKTNNESMLSTLIYYFWNSQVPLTEEICQRIKGLWRVLFEKAIKMENPEIDKYVLSGCSKWLDNMKVLDEEIYGWLMKTAPYVSELDRMHTFKALLKHALNSPKNVGGIAREIFRTTITYDLSRGTTTQIIEILYENGENEVADEICLMHGEKGIHFLREVYNKFR